MFNLRLGDCLEIMPTLSDASIDAIIADIPFGTTQCKWDLVIPLEPMWKELKRITKKHSAIVLFGSQPFTGVLVVSNLPNFKYEIIWEKDKPSDFALATKRTMKYHENILIFCDGKETYNPQMVLGTPNHPVGCGIRKKANESGANTKVVINKLDGWKHPKSVIRFNREPQPIHPTQKPVSLMEYLVKTYTNEGDMVLDFTMGSGTTGVACANLNRNFIGIEKDPSYFAIAQNRINEALGEPKPIEPKHPTKTTPHPIALPLFTTS